MAIARARRPLRVRARAWNAARLTPVAGRHTLRSMGRAETERLHATAVELSGAAVLLRGRSGAGKSDLALRLIDAGARLVADDQSVLTCRDGGVWVAAPGALSGRIEVRGLGIVPVPTSAGARVALVADLVDADKVERMPEPADVRLLGVSVPRIVLAPFEASAPAKLRLAVRLAMHGILPGHETADEP